MPQRIKFDRDEARRLRAIGWQVQEIAAHLGVTRQAIYAGLARPSLHQDWLRSLSPEALKKYHSLRRKLALAQVPEAYEAARQLMWNQGKVNHAPLNPVRMIKVYDVYSTINPDEPYRVKALSRSQACYLALKAARDAGYRVSFSSFKARTIRVRLEQENDHAPDTSL